jgi:outer membrane porin, OprD family
VIQSTDPSECISGTTLCTGTTHTIEEAWAIGGSIEYKSGWLYDHFRVGAEYFGSWPLYDGENAGDTKLLTSTGSSYSVLGQAYAQVKYWDQVLTAGDSEYRTPYVNRQFNRMTPNTFEGVSLKGTLPALLREDQFLDYLVGYLSKIKQRNSDEFVPMSQLLGPADKYYGTYIAQFLFTAWGASFGLSEYYTPQNLDISYAEVAWTPRVGGKYGLKMSVQYTLQRDVGDGASLVDILEREPAASNVGARATFSYEGSVLTLAYSLTGASGAIVSPWGSSPSYTNGSIRNSNRPNEQAALLNYSYDFKKLDVPGLSATAIYSYAWDAVDPTRGQSLSNQWELDVLADYKIPEGAFKGLWFRLQRNQLQNVDGTNSIKQWRAIVYWETPLI